MVPLGPSLPAPESVFLGLPALLQEGHAVPFFHGAGQGQPLGADLGKGPGAD